MNSTYGQMNSFQQNLKLLMMAKTQPNQTLDNFGNRPEKQNLPDSNIWKPESLSPWANNLTNLSAMLVNLHAKSDFHLQMTLLGCNFPESHMNSFIGREVSNLTIWRAGQPTKPDQWRTGEF